jgi:hypothetical protein
MLRGYGKISQLTKFQKITTPSYEDSSEDTYVPIPFSFVNGVLDIHIQDNVQNNLINNGTSPDYRTEYQCKTIGLPRLVTGLGPKMLEWLENFLRNRIGGPITAIQIHTPGHVMKTQFVLENNAYGEFLEADVDDSTYAITSIPPSSDEYIFGSSANNFRTVYIFKTPITFSFKTNGTIRYLTLFSNFSAWEDD